MKKRIISLLIVLACCIAPVALVGPGCVGPASVDQQAIDTTAIILRGAARDGAIVAMQDNPATKAYFELASEVLGTFLTGKDVTPGAFQTALLGIKLKELESPWVQIGLGTVIDLYQLYYGQYVKNKVNGDAYAKAFLVAIQDGFNMALGKPITPSKYRYHSQGKACGVSVLPRPMK